MQEHYKMDSLTYEIHKPNATPLQYIINGWGQEPPTPNQFYMWRYYINGKLESDTLKEYVFTDDGAVNGNYISGMSIFLIKAKVGDTITVETSIIPKQYYDFLMSLMLETVWSSPAFNGPPANVPSNVSNGGLGFFVARDPDYCKVVIKK